MLLALVCGFIGVVLSHSCPQGYEEHPLIIVSMDGFRAEYLKRNLTPNIQAMKERGVAPPYISASTPTVTFPNHYTIVTVSNIVYFNI